MTRPRIRPVAAPMAIRVGVDTGAATLRSVSLAEEAWASGVELDSEVAAPRALLVGLEPIVVRPAVDLDRGGGLQRREPARRPALLGEGLELLVGEAVLVDDRVEFGSGDGRARRVAGDLVLELVALGLEVVELLEHLVTFGGELALLIGGDEVVEHVGGGVGQEDGLVRIGGDGGDVDGQHVVAGDGGDVVVDRVDADVERRGDPVGDLGRADEEGGLLEVGHRGGTGWAGRAVDDEGVRGLVVGGLVAGLLLQEVGDEPGQDPDDQPERDPLPTTSQHRRRTGAARWEDHRRRPWAASTCPIGPMVR